MKHLDDQDTLINETPWWSKHLGDQDTVDTTLYDVKMYIVISLRYMKLKKW